MRQPQCKYLVRPRTGKPFSGAGERRVRCRGPCCPPGCVGFAGGPPADPELRVPLSSPVASGLCQEPAPLLWSPLWPVPFAPTLPLRTDLLMKAFCGEVTRPGCGNRGLTGDWAEEGKREGEEDGEGEGPSPQSRSRWRRKTWACLSLRGSGSGTGWKSLWSLEFAYTQAHMGVCGGADNPLSAGSAEA